MSSPMCRDCMTAAWVLRRIGFHDTIGWGKLMGPVATVHASHSNTKGQSLCSAYRSELAWLTAGRPTRILVYLAHPVSPAGDVTFHDNVSSATRWLRYLRRLPVSTLSEFAGVYYEQKPLIMAPWLAAIEEDELHPGGRDGALSDCRDMVSMFDELWAVGGSVTEGMKVEISGAKVARDLTHLGRYPNDGAIQLLSQAKPQGQNGKPKSKSNGRSGR